MFGSRLALAEQLARKLLARAPDTGCHRTLRDAQGQRSLDLGQAFDLEQDEDESKWIRQPTENAIQVLARSPLFEQLFWIRGVIGVFSRIFAGLLSAAPTRAAELVAHMKHRFEQESAFAAWPQIGKTRRSDQHRLLSRVVCVDWVEAPTPGHTPDEAKMLPNQLLDPLGLP
jgi:hypothetical protein